MTFSITNMKIKNLILKFIFSSYIVFDDLPSDLKIFSNNFIPFIKKKPTSIY